VSFSIALAAKAQPHFDQKTAISADADDVNVTCNFSSALVIYHDNPKAEEYGVTQSMKVIDGEISKETLALDGSMRATNSRTWSKLHVDYLGERNSTEFVGDGGDIIRISHLVGDYGNPLKGTYDARMVSLALLWTVISKGRCQLE
jgi:hypothetical protein